MNRTGFLAAVACAFTLLSGADAANDVAQQTRLRWKLTAGQQFLVTTNTIRRWESKFLGSPITEEQEYEFDHRIKILSVNEQGIARGIISVERVEMKDRLGRAHISVAANGNISGQANHLDGIVRSLRNSQAEFAVSNIGHILSVKSSGTDSDNETWRTALPLPFVSAHLSLKGLEESLGQIFVPLPEAPAKPGDKWLQTINLQLGTGFGYSRIHLTFSYNSPTVVDGRQAEEIIAAGVLELSPNSSLKTLSQNCTGTIRFDTGKGMPVSNVRQQKAVSTINDSRSQSTTSATIRMRYSPIGDTSTPQ